MTTSRFYTENIVGMGLLSNRGLPSRIMKYSHLGIKQEYLLSNSNSYISVQLA